MCADVIDIVDVSEPPAAAATVGLRTVASASSSLRSSVVGAETGSEASGILSSAISAAPGSS